MAATREEQSANIALAALLRGVGEFAHRAAPTRTAAETLSRFATDGLPWLASNTRAACALETAVGSYHPKNAEERLLDTAWRFAGQADSDKPLHAERMRWPLSTVFRTESLDIRPAEVPLAKLEFSESIFSANERTSPKALQELFEGFANAMSEIMPADISALIQTLLVALETFAWCVPVDGQEDISIFELSRSVSAIAAALAAQGQSGEPGTDYSKMNLMLAVGDLGGIQRFLYTIVASKAARMLRGRSLGLQLIADAIANRILSHFELPATNLLYSGGGKLWLLLPASERDALLKVAEEIDLKLNEMYASRLTFGIGCALIPLAKRGSGASSIWESATQDLAHRRRRRFSQSMARSYEQIFAPFGDGDRACRICGVLSRELKPLSRDDDDSERLACPRCRDFVKLGHRATRARVIVRLPRATASVFQPLFRYSPDIGEDDYLLYEDDSITKTAPTAATVMWINGPPRSWDGSAGQAIWLAGLNRATGDDGEPLDLDELARNSDGINRLGILRMDVDSLGRIFRDGVRDRASLPRIAALSRHLTYFFGSYLSTQLSGARFRKKLQVIYSGGDDVFIVGSWSEIPLIARRIRTDLDRFTGGHPKWGISAGIEIMLPTFPIAEVAERAGEAEERAKAYRRRVGRPKDAVCFLDEVFGWEEFEVLCNLRNTLSELFSREDRESLPRATLRLLHAIACEARRAGDLIGQSSRSGGDTREIQSAVKRGKWAWQAAYGIARASSRGPKTDKLRELYQHLEKCDWRNSSSLRPLLWLLKPASEWVDLLNREKRT